MPRQKNLLEAFTAPDTPEGSPPAGRTPSLPSFGAGGGGGRGWLVLLGFALCFALGYAVGRGRAPVAEAGELEPPSAAQGAPRPAVQPRSFEARPSAQEGAAPAATRLEESPLYDPANQYTVVVGAYSKSASDLAWATHDHLAEEGFEVFPPVASKNYLLLLVGAAPKSSDLAETEARVRKLERDGKKPYDDAYRQPIDQLIPSRIPSKN